MDEEERAEQWCGLKQNFNLGLIHRGWTKDLSGFEASMALFSTLLSASHRLWAI